MDRMFSADGFMEESARRRAFRPICALAPQLDGEADEGEPQMTQIYADFLFEGTASAFICVICG